MELRRYGVTFRVIKIRNTVCQTTLTDFQSSPMVQFKKNLRPLFFRTYCHLLTRMQLNFIARVGSLNTRNECRRKTHCQQHESLSLHYLPSTGRRLLEDSFIKSPAWTALTTRNTTKIILLYKYLTHTHTHTNMIALQLNVLINVIHQLLVTSKGRSTFPNSNNGKISRKLRSQCLYV